MLNKSLTYGLLMAIILGWSGLVCGHLLKIQPLTEHEQVHTINEDGRTLESNGILSLLIEQTLREHYGQHRVALRQFPLVCHLATIVVVFALGTIIGGRRLGLLSAFLHACSAWAISVAIHVRFFALNDLLIALSTLFLLLALTKKTHWWWPLYCLCLLGCVASMVLSIQIVACHALILIAFRRRTKIAEHHFICFAICVAMAAHLLVFLYQRDRDAAYRFTYPPFNVTTVLEQVDLSLSSGISRTHLPSYYDESKVLPLDSAINCSKVLLLINALAILYALVVLWRPKLSRRYAVNRAGVPLGVIFGRTYTLTVLVAFLTMAGLGLINHRNFINADTFTWLLPLQSIFLALALNDTWYWEKYDGPLPQSVGDLLLPYVTPNQKTSRPLWFWLSCTALLGAAPLLANATYMHGQGDETVFVWLSQHTTASDIVFVDNITERDWHRNLSHDNDLSLLSRLTTYVEPRRYRMEFDVDTGFESQRVYSAMRQLPPQCYRLGQRIWLVTNHIASPDIDKRFYYIDHAARLHGLSTSITSINDGKLCNFCIYQIKLEKLKPMPKPVPNRTDNMATGEFVPQGPQINTYKPQRPGLRNSAPVGPMMNGTAPVGPMMNGTAPVGPMMNGTAPVGPTMNGKAAVGPMMNSTAPADPR